ncbi:PP2C family protein-serine/threonine phosphatase [Alkalicoccobacillus murimartini]|uniref:Serine phosphatase RsbU (Regulator of sigma subunit) n=1 Tax=Alkalicoccobacillus murimartini TaxID=171685 RepID=A0ABT9YJ03_9BACI|nr:PP2C family protein-serine/threonine phosphatase [Alkalicoccobacillus murimartini]MDQ0207701.1 serine phosphatase RsbU (regulator of sigma subunit) [Alkalicoccobacillus murimartini]
MQRPPETDKQVDTQKENLGKTLQREIDLAKNIQMTLLNGDVPVFDNGQLSGVSVPARLIGGDYFDFYHLKNGCIRIVIGDVMGKGIPAAMLMILTRGAFRSASETTRSPGDTLSSMNQALYKDLRKLKSFVTLFCADLDPSTGVLTYSNAGHNLPIHVQNETETIAELPKATGIMLGGLPNQIYKEQTVQLKKFDVVFFYTDGIIDAHNNQAELFGLSKLMTLLSLYKDQSADMIQNNVLAAVDQFINEMPQKDDITIVILKITNDL